MLFAFFPYNSFAVNACVENGTQAIILDPNIDPVSYEQNRFGTTWKVSYDNFTMQGVAACLSSDYGLQPYDIYTDNNGVLMDNGAVVVGGERNVNSSGKTSCWCKITYPVVSGWWLRNTNSESQMCDEWCGGDWCSYWTFMQPTTSYDGRVEKRKKIFYSIKN